MQEFSEKKIGKYKIVGKLGQGSMGTVFKAFDPFIKREVAIKTINKDFLINQEDNADEILKRFMREAQAAGRLNHPNIVSVYDYGEDDKIAYIIMEIVNGRSLKEIFDNNERFNDIACIYNMMRQLAGALSHSHKHGVIHRDIKPANIIVMGNRQIKVTDFGIANLESSDLTQVGTLMGTPHYMSPEQIRSGKINFSSDIFSAAIVFYQLLTGEKPFYAQSMTAIMHKILHETPVKPSILNPQLPSAVDQIIEKALAKQPQDRYQTADEFNQAIKLIMESNAEIKAASKKMESSEVVNNASEDNTNNSFNSHDTDKTRLIYSHEPQLNPNEATRVIRSTDIQEKANPSSVIIETSPDRSNYEIPENTIKTPSSLRIKLFASCVFLLVVLLTVFYFINTQNVKKPIKNKIVAKEKELRENTTSNNTFISIKKITDQRPEALETTRQSETDQSSEALETKMQSDIAPIVETKKHPAIIEKTAKLENIEKVNDSHISDKKEKIKVFIKPEDSAKKMELIDTKIDKNGLESNYDKPMEELSQTKKIKHEETKILTQTSSTIANDKVNQNTSKIKKKESPVETKDPLEFIRALQEMAE